MTRVTAVGIACVMLVGIVAVHWPHGLFMNWYGNQKGEGFEYHLPVLGIAITLIIGGGGACSLDGALSNVKSMSLLAISSDDLISHLSSDFLNRL